MNMFWCIFLIAIVLTVFSIFSIYLIIVDFEECEIKILLSTVFSTLGAILLLTITLPTVPKIIKNQITVSEGKCSLYVTESRGNDILNIRLGEQYFESNPGHFDIKKGSYYCKVTHYEDTEWATEMKIYKNKNSKKILESY